jgi:hypothetical protein
MTRSVTQPGSGTAELRQAGLDRLLALAARPPEPADEGIPGAYDDPVAQRVRARRRRIRESGLKVTG